MAYCYASQNGCCGGYDIMVVAARGHKPVAVTTVSGSCGGYWPRPNDFGWVPVTCDEMRRLESSGFWKPAFYVREEDAHGRRWMEIDEETALKIAPELGEWLGVRWETQFC